MKKLATTLLVPILAAISLSSCTLDSASFGVNAVSYPTHRVYAPVYTPVHKPAIYYTPSYGYRRHVDVRPDWLRYGSHCAPPRRHYRHY